MILKNRYLLMDKFNSEGAHGTIYRAKDMVEFHIVLVKLTTDQDMNYKEH